MINSDYRKILFFSALIVVLTSVIVFVSYSDDVLYPDEVGYYVASSSDEELPYAEDEDFEVEEDYYNASGSEYSQFGSSRDSGIAGSLEDYFLKLENKPQDVDGVLEEEIIIDEESSSPVLLAPLANSINYDDNYKNTVVFTGRFNNSSCRLVVPYDTYKSLSVVNGVLLNVGNTAITGRILYGSSEITHNAYDTYNYILNPVYGSTSNVWRYGSFNYQRHYYLYTSSTGNQSIQYSDLYGNFIVEDTTIHFATSERLYYFGLVALLVMGVFLCLKR